MGKDFYNLPKFLNYFQKQKILSLNNAKKNLKIY